MKPPQLKPRYEKNYNVLTPTKVSKKNENKKEADCRGVAVALHVRPAGRETKLVCAYVNTDSHNQDGVDTEVQDSMN